MFMYMKNNSSAFMQWCDEWVNIHALISPSWLYTSWYIAVASKIIVILLIYKTQIKEQCSLILIMDDLKKKEFPTFSISFDGSLWVDIV